MKILLQQAHIIDPASPFHDSVRDIFIENGIISKVDFTLNEEADRTINIQGVHVSPGWLDVFTNFYHPEFG